MTNISWHGGVPWLRGALEAAQLRDPALPDRIALAARSYRAGDDLTTEPERDRSGKVIAGRTRVHAVGISVVVGDRDGTVLAWKAAAAPRPRQAVAALASPPRRRVVTAKPSPPKKKRDRRPTRAPASYQELKSWLEEGGCTVELSNGGHYRVEKPDGTLAGTIPATPSDHRSLPNSVSTMRRATGLRLRKDHE